MKRKKPDSLMLRRAAVLLATRSRSQSLSDIAAGAGVSFYWLQKFAAGRSRSPNVRDVEALYTYLSGSPLILD